MIPNLPKSRADWLYVVNAAGMVCSLMIFGGLSLLAYSFYWNSHAESADAVILSYSEDTAGNRSALLQFADDAGASYQVTIDAVTPFSEEAGKTVRIRYRPDDPTDAKLDKSLEHWFPGGFLTVWGLVWAVVLFSIVQRLK